MRHSLRRANAADTEPIAGLHHRAWQEAYGGPPPGGSLLVADEGLTVVAENEVGELSGFCALVFPSRDDDADNVTCEVAAIYVEPGRWRWGIGRALMRTTLDQATGQGYEVVTLWLPEPNDGARKFFESFGFKPDDAIDGGSVRMRLTLA
jgi:GNAT superfamily N-acetyltransferase